MLTVLAFAAAVAQQQYHSSQGWVLQDEQFLVTGTYCHGSGCMFPRTRRDGAVVWDLKLSEPQLAKLHTAPEAWDITLDCRRRLTHFVRCRVLGRESYPSHVVTIACGLLRRVHIDTTRSLIARPGGRAIIRIVHADAGCPSWRCVPVIHPSGPGPAAT